jgi:hypothetical protein
MVIGMNRNKSKESDPETQQIRGRLQALRSALLGLHKSLVDSERVEYEKVIGKIQSPNHFLQLLTTDPWFAWLSPLSKLIVSIDEALDAKEPLLAKNADGFVQQANRLLVASETGEGFASHYHEALQRDPDVVLAHSEVAKLRSRRKAG